MSIPYEARMLDVSVVQPNNRPNNLSFQVIHLRPLPVDDCMALMQKYRNDINPRTLQAIGVLSGGIPRKCSTNDGSGCV